MFQIAKISNALANKVSSELNYNNDKKEVIAYGAFAFVQTFIILSILVVLGLIFNVLLEVLILSITTSILRKYSGGAHASSPETCTIISIVVCMSEAIFIVYYLVPIMDILSVISIVFISYIWGYYWIYKLAPVDSSSKPIGNKEKKKKLKKFSILIMSVYLILTILSVVLYLFSGKASYVSYMFCICGSIWWQVFTLTKSGHIIMGKFDAILNKI